MKSVLNIHWKDRCWSWNSNTLATWCEELTHLKSLWCWERLKVGGEGDDRGWDGWMTSPTQWIWVWANSGSWWWTGRPGVLQSLGSQRVRHDWATELNWTELKNMSSCLGFRIWEIYINTPSLMKTLVFLFAKHVFPVTWHDNVRSQISLSLHPLISQHWR